MLLHMCAVKDRAADAFGRPFFVQSEGLGIRGFIDEVNRVSEDNPLNKHPDDFDLFKLGTWDDNSCQFDLELSPKLLLLGKNAVR